MCRRDSRKALVSILTPVLVLLIAAGAVRAYPPAPEVVARWAAEGRLEELAAVESAAAAKGVNRLPRQPLLTTRSGEREREVVTRQAVVILIEFTDNPADLIEYPPAHFAELLFSEGVYPTGSMRDYYWENSYGNFEVTGEVSDWLMMPHTYAYYTDGEYGFGDYPQNAQRMVEDAVIAADPYIDFSLFDNDGPDGIPHSGDDDGYVDALFVVHAGPEGAGGDGWSIWSHAWETTYDVPVDGVFAHRYSTEPEEGTIGVFCHEFGHVLGLPDLYDYGYDSWGVGRWSVMSFGVHVDGGRTPVHFDAWCKEQLGFLDPVIVTLPRFDEVILPVEDNPVAYKLWTNGQPENEYFIAEYRRSWGFDEYLTAEGLLVYHVDMLTEGNDHQLCGTGWPHYQVAVEQADGECELEYLLSAWDPGDPFPGAGGAMNPNYAFTDLSTPSSRAYDGTITRVKIRNIAFGEGNMTADLLVTPEVGADVPADGREQAFRGAGSGLRVSPNPLNPATRLTYRVDGTPGEAARVALALFAPDGRRVKTLFQGGMIPGEYEVSWDGRDDDGRELPSGVYLARLEVEGVATHHKVILAR